MSKPKASGKTEIPDHLLKSLLTESELRMLSNRFTIARLLDEGLSIRQIAAQVKVGTDTVVRVSKLLSKKGIKGKIVREKLPFKTKTPWIFGKSL